MTKSIILAAALLAISLPAVAIDANNSKLYMDMQSPKTSGSQYLKSAVSPQQPGDEFNTGKDKSIYEYNYKSVKRAFLYSLVIPGWGQKYAGSHVAKPIFFLSAEAATWIFHFKYQKDGNNQTDAFQAFANVNWQDSSYRNWLIDTIGVPSDSAFTHQLPSTKTQQYYEMIGKYDQFRAGWNDWADSTGLVSPHRNSYLIMREKANNTLDKAKTFLVFTMINHVVSAFDAALAANRHNHSQSGDNWMSMSTEMKYYSATDQIPIVRLTHRF